MFERLSDRLNRTFKKLKGQGKLTEKNIQDALKEVRIALLEADVHYRIVKRFIGKIKERAIGEEVLDSLTPTQQVIKIVNEELIRLMGGEREDLRLLGRPPFKIMLVGLQGSGKTTTAGKLALFLRKRGRNPMLVPADIYRPAAIDQLKKLADNISMPIYLPEDGMKPEDICEKAISMTSHFGSDTVIIDTAGRLHIDQELMEELVRIKQRIDPTEILLIADAMTGQDAVNVAREFNERLNITGVILTKMDGDARGGAALSIREVTQTPIKFIGTGEKLSALEPFHPDRMASRILGMGDVLSLIEKAQEEFDEKMAIRFQEKLKRREFDLEDFRDQIRQMKKLGSLQQILSLIPGLGRLKQLKHMEIDDRELIKIEAIINSMTKEERRNYKIINASRKKRIAKGSGTSVQDVNRLLKNFAKTKRMMEEFTRKGLPSIFN